jgi:Cof subfamily protein (haloacid dehalogenase superfamily)
MMKRNIRMIGLDLDGTLLDSNKVFTEYARRVIGQAVERGIIVLPATGRPVSGIPKEILGFPGIRYALTSNGARVLDLQENKVLYERLISYEAGGRLLEILKRYDALLEIYYDGIGYANEEDLKVVERYMPSAPMLAYIRNTRRPVEDVFRMYHGEHRPVDKIQALFASQEEKRAAFAEVRETLPEITVCGALHNNLEANAKEARKGVALIKLGEFLGISKEEIMACGDGSNDIEMVKEAGLGVAMSNAIDEVKAAADYVTCSNDEDGAAKAIEKYVLQ